nr:fructosamine kinase family protein [Lachnospiraceae bacterium]
DRSESISFLMMELIERGNSKPDTFSVMGYEYAGMHLADTEGFVSGGRYGFLHDNFIGSLARKTA